LGAGHPNLEISYGWDAAAKKATVTIAQTQEGAGVTRVFDLPLTVDIYDNSGKAVRKNIRVSQRKQSFSFDADSKPALINVDATKTLLCVKTDQHTPEEWAFQYRHAPLFRDRWEALEGLQGEPTPLSQQIGMEALKDNSPAIRLRALSAYDANNTDMLADVERMASSDPDNMVRANCISILAELKDKKYIPIFEKGMGNTQPYSVVSPSLMGLYQADPEAALKASKVLQNDESDAFTEVLSTMYSEDPKEENKAYFDNKLEKIDGFPSFPFINNYQKFLIGLHNNEALDAGIEKLKAIALNLSTSEWRRFASTKALFDLRNTVREMGQEEKAVALEKMIADIKANETDQMLKTYYDGF
jgi:aminopeptidase N